MRVRAGIAGPLDTTSSRGKSVLGAIAGDVIGQVYEFDSIKTTDFPLFKVESTFTDDTVLTVAVADVIMHGGDYTRVFKEYFERYPGRSYGGMFHSWASSAETEPYNSFGNGSAMRVSPVGFAFDSLEEVLAEAKRSAEVTHNHPEGIKGAQAVAGAIFLASVNANLICPLFGGLKSPHFDDKVLLMET